MAKLFSFIIVLTLVTVAYGSFPGARKYVVPIRETRPEKYPGECVPRACTKETEEQDCYEPGCVCDDVVGTCRDKECADLECATVDDCPSGCNCDSSSSTCYENQPEPQPQPQPLEVCRGGDPCEDNINHTDCVGVCTCEEFEYENGDVGLECVRPDGYESGSESGSESNGYQSGSDSGSDSEH